MALDATSCYGTLVDWADGLTSESGAYRRVKRVAGRLEGGRDCGSAGGLVRASDDP